MENTNPNAPPGDASANEQAGDAEGLARQLNECESKLAEMRETVLRERAELDNQRKRMQRDLEQARKFANERVLADLLPVFDSLERGLAVGNADAASLRSGMDLTLRELTRIAESAGLTVIDAVGKPFDPERHQAVSVAETAAQAPDTVVSALQKGYLLSDRLLRPALVVVAKRPS